MGSLEEYSADEFIGESAKSTDYTLEMMLAEFGDLIDESALASEPTTVQSCDLNDEDIQLRLFEDLHVDMRWANRFEGAGINTVGDLLGLDADSLLSIKGIGETAIAELEEGLRKKDLPTVESLSCYKPLNNTIHSTTPDNSYALKPFPVEVIIDYISGPSLNLELDEWGQHFFGELPYVDNPEGGLVEKNDDISLCDIPGLYELIPYPHNLYLGKYEPVSSLLTSSLEHMITDFGFASASSITDCLICNIGGPNELDEILERYTDEIKRDYPPELLLIPLAWLFPSLDDTLAQFGNVEGLFGENKSILSIYLAQALEEALQRLFANSSAPYKIDALFIDAFDELNCGCDSRAREIYIKRNGLGESRKTLEEIGQKLDITRERVRQIESKTQGRFNPLKSERLLLLRLAMFNIAKEIGSAGTIDDLCESFVARGLFETDADCVGFLELMPEYNIKKTTGSFVLSGYPCMHCDNAITVIEDIASSSSCRTHEEFIEHVGCKHCKVETVLTISVFDHCKGVRVSSEYIGVPNNPVMRASLKPTSERALLHAILYEADRALSYDEMIDQVYQACGNKPSKNKVGSQVGSFSDCMLWGRGTYIHEKNAPYPEELLKIISDLIVDVFDVNQIPIVGVEGIYSKFEDDLQTMGIPTHHALYSLLRKYGDKRLKLQEYPWICNAYCIGERTSFAKYFYSILENNNGFITDEHARVIAEKTMAQYFALGGLAEYSPFLINANGGWYDIESAGFDMQGIEQLANEIASKMCDDDIVSTVKIFEDHRERCHALGVKSYDILYYLIDMIEDDLPIEATRRPHLVKSTTKHMSVREAVRRYVRNSDKPVSYDEIVEEFKVKRGISIAGICNALLIGDDIVLTNTDEYWSKTNLGLNQDYIERFENELTERIGNCRKYSDLFYRRDEVLPNIRQVEAPHGLRWNDELLKTVVNNSTNYKVFGEFGSCLVNLRDNPNVLTIEAFYYNLLENEFLGWATFDQFAEHCTSYGIREHYEPEFFDAFDSISADDMSIECIA